MSMQAAAKAKEKVASPCAMPKQVPNAKTQDKESDAAQNDHGNGLAEGDSFKLVSIFKVYSHGLVCFICEKAIGMGAVDTISRHLKRHHSELLPEIPSMKQLHTQLVDTRKKLEKQSSVPSGEIVFWYKCFKCGNSFMCGHSRSQYFDQLLNPAISRHSTDP